MKWVSIVLLIVLVLPMVVLSPRLYKDYTKKKSFKNTYAILNAKSGMAIRVHNAEIDDGAKIILYPHHNWECTTWQFIQLEENKFLLKNLYTQKTFQPSMSPQFNADLQQTTLGGSTLQYWELEQQPDEAYRIRLSNTDLYITSISDTTNSVLLLRPRSDETGQFWKLIRQNPII